MLRGVENPSINIFLKIIRKNKKILIVYKKVGETPLQVLDKLKKEFTLLNSAKSNLTGLSFLKNQKLAYAGRLDPMAEGKLLVLIGDECKKIKRYLNLDKEYYFEILLGFKTDTGDVLGLIKKINSSILKINRDNFSRKITKMTGKQKMKYPLFSSKTVNGKSLFEYAKKGQISEIIIPEKEIEIYNIKYLGQKILTKNRLQKELFDKINLVEEKGVNDFRKKEILERWKNELSKKDKKNKKEKFLILKFSAIVSSGAYIRNIAEKISEEILSSHGLAWSIRRTKIGIYKKFFNFGFWLKQF